MGHRLPVMDQEDLVHCMLRWAPSQLKHRHCPTHLTDTSKVPSFVHLLTR